jgi:hypothetical protein
MPEANATRRPVRGAPCPLIAVAIFAGVGITVILGQRCVDPGSRDTPAAIRERWGVDELHVRRSAAGHLLDFRYRVVDPVKAAPIQARRNRPELVHRSSGVRMGVPQTPKAGALWNAGTPRAGRTYFALFTNRGGIARRGDRVSVAIGPLRATDLVVE